MGFHEGITTIALCSAVILDVGVRDKMQVAYD